MPELPEVEIIRRGLLPEVTGRTFDRPRLLFTGSVRFPPPDLFCQKLAGRAIAGLERHGKYLIFRLDRGELVVHLRMTGRLIYAADPAAVADRYLRVIMPFTAGTALHFSDMRKFGGLWLYDPELKAPESGYHRLGPDIYREVDPNRFATLLRRHPRARLKPLLLNQEILAGLGNIYVDESLFRCRLHPCRRAGSLAVDDINALYTAIKTVLEEALAHGGSSTRNYRNARGEKGEFQHFFQVYSRKGEPCPRCGEPVSRRVVAGRGTYFCPRCQREKS